MGPASMCCDSCRPSSSLSWKLIDCWIRLARFSAHKRRKALNGDNRNDCTSNKYAGRQARLSGCCGYQQGGGGVLAGVGGSAERQAPARGSSSTACREDAGAPVPETLDEDTGVVRGGDE